MNKTSSVILLAGLLAACDESQPPISADTGADVQTLDISADAPRPDQKTPDQQVPDQALPDASVPDGQIEERHSW